MRYSLSFLVVGYLAIGILSPNVARAQELPLQAPSSKLMRLQLPISSSLQDLPNLLRPHLEVLQQPGVGLRLGSTQLSPTGRHNYYQQHYLGYAIACAGVKVNLDTAGKLILLTHELVQPANWQLPTNYVATEKGLAALGLGGYAVLKKDTLWYPVGATYVLAYRLICNLGSRSQQAWIDVATGQGLAVTERGSYLQAKRAAGRDTTGYSLIYVPDPLTTARVPYGGAYQDNNNEDSPALTAARQPVQLRELSYYGGQFHLQGPYVRVVDSTGPVVTPVTSPIAQFFFTRSQSGFEDCMVYHHLDTIQRYVQQLGYNLQRYPLAADSHGEDDDNSHYTWPLPGGSVGGLLSFGIGGIHDAQDADVVVHEYMHALSYAAAPESNVGWERKGLDEGCADYWAASYSKAISPYNWTKVYNWDGNTPTWHGRPTHAALNYPNLKDSITQGNLPSYYHFGEVWCSALMDAWDLIGREALDRTLLAELYFNTPNMEMPQAAQLLLVADSLVNGGAYRHILQRSLCRRGLLPEGLCGLADTLVQVVTLKGVVIFPNPAGHTVSIAADKVNDSSLRLTVLSTAGALMLTTPLQPGITLLPVEQLTAGMYIFRVDGASGLSMHQKIIIEH